MSVKRFDHDVRWNGQTPKSVMVEDEDGYYVLAQDYDDLKTHATTMAIMLSRLIGTKDHVTHCDRTMGDSHPCTCGAQQAWHYLKTHAADPREQRNAET